MNHNSSQESGSAPEPLDAIPGSKPLTPLSGSYPPQPETSRKPPGYDPPQYEQYPPTAYGQQSPAAGASTVQFNQLEQPLPGAPPYPTSPATQRRGFPVWVWVLAGLAVLSCAACVGVGVLGGNVVGWFVKEIGEPAAVATQYSVALRAHDFNQAHSYFATGLARVYSQDELQADWLALENRGQITGSSYESIHVENDTATIAWVLRAGEDKYATTLTLKKAGSEWKITGGDPGPVPQP